MKQTHRLFDSSSRSILGLCSSYKRNDRSWSSLDYFGSVGVSRGIGGRGNWTCTGRSMASTVVGNRVDEHLKAQVLAMTVEGKTVLSAQGLVCHAKLVGQVLAHAIVLHGLGLRLSQLTNGKVSELDYETGNADMAYQFVC